MGTITPHRRGSTWRTRTTGDRMADPTPNARGSTGVRPLHPPAPHAGINLNPTRFGTSTSTQPRTNRDTPAWRSSVGGPLPRPLGESTAMTEDLKPAQPRARGSTRARGSMRQMRPQPRRAGIDRTRQLNLKPDATPTTSAITSSDCWFGRQRRHLPRVCGDQRQQDMRAPLLQDATPRARGSTPGGVAETPADARYPARAGRAGIDLPWCGVGPATPVNGNRKLHTSGN